MLKLELKDATKISEKAVYYMEENKKLLELWEKEERTEAGTFSETELKIGAKQDFTLNKSWITLHNTIGQENRYYVESLVIKVRYAYAPALNVYLKLASFVANGIAKENTYGEGGFEQVTCLGNPVLSHYSSSIAPIVSDFEDDFKWEKITLLGYKEINRFEDIGEVNRDIEKQALTDLEVEMLLHDIPGELG